MKTENLYFSYFYKMEHIYHFAHIGLETWETEPIKVIIRRDLVSDLSSHSIGSRILEIALKEK